MDRIAAAEVFVAIAERASLTAAADALCMSKPMISRYLAAMEAWAGVRLFHRTTRRMTLTLAGEEALSQCQQLLSVASKVAVHPAVGGGSSRGTLRISCSHAMGQAIVAAAISEYQRMYPQVSVDLIVENRALNLVEERVDLALRVTNAPHASLIARRLGTCESVICASPAYLHQRGLPEHPGDLSAHNCLVYSNFTRGVWTLRHRASGETTSTPVAGTLSANDSLFLLGAALNDGGITIQPTLSARRHVSIGSLVPVLEDYDPVALDVYAVYASREHMSPALRSMLDHLANWFVRDDVASLLEGLPR